MPDILKSVFLGQILTLAQGFLYGEVKRDGSFRPNPEGRIIKNQNDENKKPDGQTVRPKKAVYLPSISTCNIANIYSV